VLDCHLTSLPEGERGRGSKRESQRKRERGGEKERASERARERERERERDVAFLGLFDAVSGALDFQFDDLEHHVPHLVFRHCFVER